jgi:DeoR/GlpR family transcriptional regulator of sugar metabolism
MFAQERQQQILEILARKKRLRVTDLESALKVSPATLRRDLLQLEQAGKLLRTHGGLLHPEYLGGEPAFSRKVRAAVEAKRQIAAAAAAHVPPGATIFVDAGTSTLELGKLLLRRGDITIFTNSAPLLQERAGPKAQLVCIGGEVREVSRALVGALAMEWMKHLRFDYAAVGASGLHRSDGVSTTELNEAAIKREALNRAGTAFLLADASKWDQTAAVTFAAWNDFDHWFTDMRLGRADREALAPAGVKIHAAAS